MDLLPFFHVTLMVFMRVENTISLKEIVLPKEDPYTALALIMKQDGTLSLAEPQEYRQTDNAVYFYDDSKNENGPVEKFFIACPSRNLMELGVEAELLKGNKLFEKSKLFFAEEYTEDRAKCNQKLEPSLQKANWSYDSCGKHDENLYDVGFPVVTTDNKQDVKFIALYRICVSWAGSGDNDKGTLYTWHRIRTPKLQLQKLWEFYTLDPKGTKPLLDKRNISIYPLDEGHYAYQYVGFDDLPIKAWESTASFSINYFLIPKNEDILRGMIAVDNFIRLFSKKTDKSLDIISGLLHTTVKTKKILCKSSSCPHQPKFTEIESFWRIVLDQKRFAIMIVTQYNLVKCSDATYICHTGRIIVKEYKEGGCTYTCSVSKKWGQTVGFVLNYVAGNLELKFPRKIPAEEIHPSQSQPENMLTIYNFMKNKNFMSALRYADADLAKEVLVQGNVRR